jgi:hypothetical protein
MSDWLLDDLEQEQDEYDGEDEAEASAAVVAESRAHAITTKAEHKNQDDQKDKHYSGSPCGEDSPCRCDADFVTGAIIFVFSSGCLSGRIFLGWYIPVCDGNLFVA